MVIQPTQNKPAGNDDFLRIQDLFILCLAKWYWFVISLAILLGAATIYLLKTPPVYTRSASLLIKEDGKSGSGNEAAGVLGDIDIFRTSTNINNEMLSMQSPAVMYEVVRRLHLDVNYTTDGRFYDPVIYGSDNPYEVSFFDLGDAESASFTLRPDKDGQVKLTDFTRNGEEADGDAVTALNDTVQTPVGRLLVNARPGSTAAQQTVFVSRISMQDATADYSSRLSVALNDEKSTVVNLTLQDVCTQRAEDVLNTLISVYNENWVKDKNQIAVSTSMFINERLGVIERELGNVDEDISSYKSENLLPDVQAAASMYMAESSETNAKIQTLNTQLSMTRYVRSYLTGASSRNQLLPANSGIENSGIEKQIAEYNTLQLRRNDLVANSSETNPLVVDMDHSLHALRDAIIRTLDNYVTTLNTQLRALQQSARQTTARIAANPSQGKYLLSVERQQKVKESLYLFLLQKREENELSQAFTAYNTRVIMPPSGSMVPTAPAKKNILLIAFVVGLIVPVAVIFLRESMNTRIRGRKDLEALTLPFVGEIPQAATKKKGTSDKKSTENNPIVVHEGSRDIINEAFRVLRTNLEFMTDKEQHSNVIVVTSFNPGSGKSFLAINIAVSLAIKQKKVLVIDGDMRHGSTSANIGSPQTGLSNYLSGHVNNLKDIIVTDARHANLQFLPVGTIPPNPTELLFSDRLKQLIDTVRSQYDYIFIDCPPIEMVADTQIIEQLADRTLFVVRTGLLERSMLPELQRIYDEKKYKNMALILNGTVGSGGHYGYRYGYRYGYHYGYGSGSYYGSK
ncbi:polysaccharide biosynthesis tyrosine autokinase [Bacteroides sp. ET489]|uniref:GumC family protein n=1 Tax=Bacteroides sp. ET489 TaxID=3057126 RepID=UPI0026715957|nr:polysaccharide biosynthesis tyrosine autokinase [Bacteroides sp. ET489]MDO3391169.1 polysaccharide biosynthesis tyrosine autokinase [Bacteroides sp. ET489]